MQGGMAPAHGFRTTEVAEDVAYLRTVMVNVYFCGSAGAGDRSWVLVDAGVNGSANAIRHAAAERFGEGARPSCIVLTHGHFDHVGALRELADEWDVPVYAHELEHPYITGLSAYPPPDPTVGGGVMAGLSWAYPRGPFDVGERARFLPPDGSVPGLPGWRWIHTPGHTAGHVSLFREEDGVLIAGDAFITVKQESAFAVMLQRAEVHGPPMYYTQDWRSAARSVRLLALLQPAVAATGHGAPMRGAAMAAALEDLARDFETVAVPSRGRYVREPAVADRDGLQYVPPHRASDYTPLLALGAALLGGVLVLRYLVGSRDGDEDEDDE